MKNKTTLTIAFLLIASIFPIIAGANPTVGSSDYGILTKEWSFDMHFYTWGYYGSSPAIADLGPQVNNLGTDPDSDLEIVTGSDEIWGPPGSSGVWRAFDSGGNLEWQTGTLTDEARSSPAIIDIDGDGDLEIAAGTTSGWYFEVMDHQGNFIWTFPKYPGRYLGGPFVWPSSPAVADLDTTVDGLEIVIGNRYLGNVWCFDGDNSDGVDEGVTINDPNDFPGFGYTLGTEGTDWDVLWIFDTDGSFDQIFASPAIGDVDNDGSLEVVIGSPDSKVYILDGASGILETSYTTMGGIHASAAIANIDNDPYLEIVIGSSDGYVYCIESDGTTVTHEWSYLTGASVFSSAAIGDIDADGSMEIVVGSNDGNVYALDSTGGLKWSYPTGGTVYSSPALAKKVVCTTYNTEWQMFRHDAQRTGFYGPSSEILDVYVGSDDGYLYLINGKHGVLVDRFEVNTAWYPSPQGGIHTSPSIADVDGDKRLEIFFYDWGDDSVHNGHTFWSVENGATPVSKIFLTPNRLNLKRSSEHQFKIHVYPCDPLEVYVGDTALVYVDLDGDGVFEEEEWCEAVVSSTDVDGAATDIAIKVYVTGLTDNDPLVILYDVSGYPIGYVLQLDTFINGKK